MNMAAAMGYVPRVEEFSATPKLSRSSSDAGVAKCRNGAVLSEYFLKVSTTCSQY